MYLRRRTLFVFLLPLLLQGQSPSACDSCHPKESAAFANSAMGQSIHPPVHTPPGRFAQSESGGVINVDWAGGRMTHRLSELGLKAEYSIDYQVGAGKVGHSYLINAGGYLLQSPASYYRSYGWDISPGFKELAVLDFDRVVGDRCLFCHSANTEFSGKRKLKPEAIVTAIDCSRCHGDTRQHLARPSKATLVNPARLAVRARNSVCEQCHLEGVSRVLNPGKQWRDFQAGDDLESTFSVYVDDKRQPTANVVSQVEQLALSRCARESGGRLWCGTCHNPHGSKIADRASEIRTICAGCHSKLSPASHTGNDRNCVSCHMPRLGPKDIAHAASTDHRILARPAKSIESGPSGVLRAWDQPAEDVQSRNLGLAELEASALPGLHSLSETGGHLLKQLPVQQQENDPVVLSALGDIALAEGQAGKAEALFRKASALAPASGEYPMYLGIASKRTGNASSAILALEDAISRDASLQQAYLELSALFIKQGEREKAESVLEAYLKWNPQSILVRSTLAGLR